MSSKRIVRGALAVMRLPPASRITSGFHRRGRQEVGSRLWCTLARDLLDWWRKSDLGGKIVQLRTVLP